MPAATRASEASATVTVQPTAPAGWPRSCHALGMTSRPPTLTPEEFVGRLLAMCVHPIAAWRTGSRGERGLIATVYAMVGYGGALAILLVRG